MKGLIIKDFKLLMMQKSFFITLAIVAIFFGITTDTIFVIGFLTMICSMFALSTISYDEFDNGNAFLFTLPITRKIYVIEKYCLGILLGFTAWTAGLFISSIALLTIQENSWKTLFLVAFSIFPLIFFLLAVMIPLQLKFGSEKRQLAMFAVVGTAILLGILINKIGKSLGFQFHSVMNSLSALSPVVLIGCYILLIFLALGISLKISIHVMEQKEF